MKAIRVEELHEEIVAAVKGYSGEVSQAIAKEVERTAKQTVKDVKRASPVRTGRYAAGWTRRKFTRSDGEVGYMIYNRNKGPLVPLLELGFTPRNSRFRVPGRPHLRPAAERNIEKMQENIKRIIERGG